MDPFSLSNVGLRTDLTGDAAVIRLTISSVGGSIICGYDIIGHDGTVLRSRTLDHVRMYDHPESVPRSILPLLIVAHECPTDGGLKTQDTVFGPALAEDAVDQNMHVICPPESATGEGYVAIMDNAACEALKGQIQRSQDVINSLCPDLADLRSRQSKQIGIGVSLTATGVAAASISGTILAVLIQAATTAATATATAGAVRLGQDHGDW